MTVQIRAGTLQAAVRVAMRLCLLLATVASATLLWQVTAQTQDGALGLLPAAMGFAWRLVEDVVTALQTDAKVHEDVLLSTPQLIAKHGYPVETHRIQTQDGYVLAFHRIPRGRGRGAGGADGAPPCAPRPVFLQHGLSAASDDWVYTGPERGLGFVLADAGFDVWLGNARGNKWTAHATLLPNDAAYWDFSWHEMGMYDLPAAIDYILNATGQQQLDYVAHSMGCMEFITMAAARPEYNAKIRTAVLLGPAVLFTHSTNSLQKLMGKRSNELYALSKAIGLHDLKGHTPLHWLLALYLCQEGNLLQPLCWAYAQYDGLNLQQVDKDFLPMYYGHYPSGAPVKNFLHYAQSIYTGELRQYDFGVEENVRKYGTESPPEYNLDNVSARVAIFYADNDVTPVPEDAELLAEQLPNLVQLRKIPNPTFNHMDFLVSRYAKELVYEPLISLLIEN